MLSVYFVRFDSLSLFLRNFIVSLLLNAAFTSDKSVALITEQTPAGDQFNFINSKPSGISNFSASSE